MTVISQMEEGKLFGLIVVNTHFPFQNDFLLNGFQKDFSMDPEVKIEFLEEEGRYPVFNHEGTYLFSLDFSQTVVESKDLGLVSRVGFILFLFSARKFPEPSQMAPFGAFCDEQFSVMPDQSGSYIKTGLIAFLFQVVTP